MAQRFYWKQYVTDKQVTFYIADLILKPGEQIEAHCHDYYEFFVVLKGTFLERCNGQELVMQPGMGQLLGPDDVHTLSNPFGEQNLLYNIAVRKDRYEQLTAPLFGSGNGSKDAPVLTWIRKAWKDSVGKYVCCINSGSPQGKRNFCSRAFAVMSW